MSGTKLLPAAAARILIGTAFILLIPFVAKQFTDQVQWDLADFVIIGCLLIGAGLIYELAAARINTRYRPAIAAVVVAAVLLVWVELAVGIFGTPLAGS